MEYRAQVSLLVRVNGGSLYGVEEAMARPLRIECPTMSRRAAMNGGIFPRANATERNLSLCVCRLETLDNSSVSIEQLSNQVSNGDDTNG